MNHNHEFLEYSPQPETALPEVEALVQQYPEIAGLRAYEHFRSDVASQQKAFIAGEVEQLSPTYVSLDGETVAGIKQPMESALSLLMPETDEKARALFETVEYRYSELFMMDMARVMNSPDATPEQQQEAREWFVLANENLYGKPDKEVFSALAGQKLQAQMEARDSDDERTAALRAELKELTGEIDATDFEPYVAPQEVVERISSLIHERFDWLVDHIDDKATYDTDGMVGALQQMLDKMQAGDLGWRVVRVPNSSSLAVSAHQHLVEVGEDRKPLKGSILKRRAIHEQGVHAGRSITAERAGWSAPAYGMPGYVDFEESLATAMEDAYKGEFSSHGEPYYLIAGLAYGHDNHAPRDFAGVYEVMWRANALRSAGDGQVDEQIIAKAQTTAFNSCMRMFRGTDFKSPGTVYLKDLAYFNGQERAWDFLRTVTTQEDLDIAFAGKVDLSRADQRAISKRIVDNMRSVS